MISSTVPSPSSSKDISRKNSTVSASPRRKSSLENVIVCKDLPTKHAHIGHTSDMQDLSLEMIEWMKGVDLQAPAILFSSESSGESGRLAQAADLWIAKQHKLVPGGKLFIRVFESKLFDDEEKHYQLVMKLGRNSSKSCFSPKSGSIEDWFIIDIEENLDIASASLEIIMETVPDQQYRQQKQSGLKQKATELLSALGKSSLRRDSFDSGSLPQTGLARIPIASLLSTGLGNKPSLEAGGKILVKGFNNRKMGEVTLHIAPTPGAVVTHENISSSSNSEDVLLHQGYISFEAKGEWKRFWGLLTRDALILRDIKHRKDQKRSATINLTDLIKLDFTGGDSQINDVGMENCLDMGFEDGTQIYMYADGEAEVKNWAEALSQAVWGQPFSSS